MFERTNIIYELEYDMLVKNNVMEDKYGNMRIESEYIPYTSEAAAWAAYQQLKAEGCDCR